MGNVNFVTEETNYLFALPIIQQLHSTVQTEISLLENKEMIYLSGSNSWRCTPGEKKITIDSLQG